MPLFRALASSRQKKESDTTLLVGNVLYRALQTR